jgi:hypothetical protein
MLLARAGQDADRFELAERATDLAEALLAGLRDARSHAARAAASPRSRRLAEQARLLLAADTNLDLDNLARAVGVSAYHLSRTFRAVTGLTLSRYRIRPPAPSSSTPTRPPPSTTGSPAPPAAASTAPSSSSAAC